LPPEGSRFLPGPHLSLPPGRGPPLVPRCLFGRCPASWPCSPVALAARRPPIPAGCQYRRQAGRAWAASGLGETVRPPTTEDLVPRRPRQLGRRRRPCGDPGIRRSPTSSTPARSNGGVWVTTNATAVKPTLAAADRQPRPRSPIGGPRPSIPPDSSFRTLVAGPRSLQQLRRQRRSRGALLRNDRTAGATWKPPHRQWPDASARASPPSRRAAATPLVTGGELVRSPSTWAPSAIFRSTNTGELVRPASRAATGTATGLPGPGVWPTGMFGRPGSSPTACSPASFQAEASGGKERPSTGKRRHRRHLDQGESARGRRLSW